MADIPIIRPTLPHFDDLEPVFRDIWASGMVTASRHVRDLERTAAGFADVSEAVAFSSCTSALILALKALELEGEVILPSFTFAATAHAAVWAGLTPVFCDCLEGTYNIDPAAAEAAVTEKTSAIMPVYCFGLPPDLDGIAAVADRHSLKIVTDAAQGWGAKYRGRPSGGFGDVECFSMSPTKVVTAIEGGLALTGNGAVAERLRRLRDYGKASDGEDMEWIGLSARMSEIHAAVGHAAVGRTEELVARRRELIAEYRAGLEGLAGVSFQAVPEDRASSGNYLVVIVDPDEARLDRDSLYQELRRRGVQTKRYFYPPVHRQKAYAEIGRVSGEMKVTEIVSARALALPLYTHMERSTIVAVVDAVRELLT